MSHLTESSRLRGLPRWAALILVLASAPVFAGHALAQGTHGSGHTPGGNAATGASATGTVETVDAAQRKVKLNHGPIPAINWPAMSMEFPAAPSVDLSKVKSGSKVKFTLSGSGGTYMVDSISPDQ